MKKYALAVFIVSLLTACGGESTPTTPKAENVTPKPTSDEFDGLKLAYIKLEQGTVSCDQKKIDQWSFAACRFISLDGKSAPQIWYFDNQKDSQKRYYAFNGKARGTYGAYFKSNTLLGDYADTFGLPIPVEMDMTKVVEAFK